MKSSSNDEEITASGAVETGKNKLLKNSGVQGFQVKIFKINFLGNSSYDGSLTRGFLQPGGSPSKADISQPGGATKVSRSISQADLMSQVQYSIIVELCVINRITDVISRCRFQRSISRVRVPKVAVLERLRKRRLALRKRKVAVPSRQ